MGGHACTMMNAVSATDDPEVEVARLWEEHRREPWPPELNAVERAGIDLEAFDSQLAGCVHTWVSNRSAFGARHRDGIRHLLRELELLLPELTEDDHPRIWRRYHRMAQLISEASPPPTS
ncbi:hypothetical protein DZF91_07305 [Actinomadura logoneensis]|uniref:Uncharacterized protein n=1 Tax=Actinomadura logoneensis TaxID=2293572 RepID=A0A372JSF0_9ACTN|nr:hypothetical protein DZF91_07305 [Actinomadura logoneensis]